jgi:hypothetical protein
LARHHVELGLHDFVAREGDFMRDLGAAEQAPGVLFQAKKIPVPLVGQLVGTDTSNGAAAVAGCGSASWILASRHSTDLAVHPDFAVDRPWTER